ncbi:MAG: hypothetical protein HYY16_19525 [Planctomycetes bacterium]|nr:hypothetical protein [Planctomycetota bacterium]
MTCDEARRWLDEETTSPEADRHRRSCASCRLAFAQARFIDRAVRAFPVPELHDDYWKIYQRRLHARLAARRPRWPVSVGIAAAVLLAVGALFAIPRPDSPARFESHAVEPTRPHWRPLIQRVESDDAATVLAALRLLETLRLPESLPTLKAALGSQPWRDEAILRTIARISPPLCESVFREALACPDLQAAATAACAELRPELAVRLLLGVYGELTVAPRAAADDLLHSHAAITRRLLLPRLFSASDAHAAMLAPLAASVHLREAAPRLLRLTRSEEHRRAAVLALARLDNPALLASLWDLPAQEIAAFVREGGPKAVEHLRRSALAANMRVARAAIDLLPEFADAQTLRTLAAAMGRSSTHAAAVRAIERVGTEEAIALLLEGFREAPSKGEIVRALGRMRSPAIRPRLLRMTGEPRVPLDALAEALEAYPREQIVPELIPWMERFDARGRAHELLKRLTGKKMGPHAGVWKQWWSTRIKEDA